MIKFVSISSDTNQEDNLYRELNIPSDSKISDFINSSSQIDLIENLKNLADKHGIKDKKSIEDYIRIKFQLLVSLLTQQRNFQYDETNRKCLHNILEIINKLSENDSDAKLNHLITLYGIFPTNSQFKHDTLAKILNFLLAREDSARVIKNNSDKLNEVLSDYFTGNFGKDSELKTIEMIAELLKLVKNYEILKNTKLTLKLKSLLSSNPITSLNMFNLLFFFTYSSFSIENYNGKNENLKNFQQKGADEENFINILKNKNLGELDSLNHSYFEGAYGAPGSDKILKNGKLWIIYLSLNSLENHSVVSFEKMEKELNLKIEDLEDVLFDGFSSELFKLMIDYETSSVKIAYVKKSSYNKECVENLKGRVSALREKISGFTKKIDSLIINQ